ncbi:MAG: biopolymer transporter ExbD [Pseudomonadota bacterium]|nr:biopolymer transporter ExbD [Pseudomonadota bacterium]
MINVRQTLRGGQNSNNNTQEINISPLIDLVFLLLIFFLVTTSFVKETGIEVQRPVASTAELKEQGNLLIGVDDSGRVFMDRRQVDVRMVRGHIARALAENPKSGVIIVADQQSQAGVIIKVMDQCRLAGAKSVSLAARRPE